jgi:hypothetical protein
VPGAVGGNCSRLSKCDPNHLLRRDRTLRPVAEYALSDREFVLGCRPERSGLPRLLRSVPHRQRTLGKLLGCRVLHKPVDGHAQRFGDVEQSLIQQSPAALFNIDQDISCDP